MIRSLYVGVCMVVGCYLAPTTAAAELRNASFELSADSEDFLADRAAYWGWWGQWINRETGWAPTRSGECLIGYHHWRMEETSTSGIYQELSGLEAGARYEFSIHVFKDPGTNAKEIELRFEPADGGEAISAKKFRMGDIWQSKWRKLSLSAKAPSDRMRIAIQVTPTDKLDKAGAIKFDDAELEQVAIQ